MAGQDLSRIDEKNTFLTSSAVQIRNDILKKFGEGILIEAIKKASERSPDKKEIEVSMGDMLDGVNELVNEYKFEMIFDKDGARLILKKSKEI